MATKTKAGLVETMKGPYGLKHVAFYQPEDVIVAPLHIVFQLSQGEDRRRFIDVMDNASQTLITAIQERMPMAAMSDGGDRKNAAQWLLDIAGARYGCEVRELEKWI